MSCSIWTNPKSGKPFVFGASAAAAMKASGTRVRVFLNLSFRGRIQRRPCMAIATCRVWSPCHRAPRLNPVLKAPLQPSKICEAPRYQSCHSLTRTSTNRAVDEARLGLIELGNCPFQSLHVEEVSHIELGSAANFRISHCSRTSRIVRPGLAWLHEAACSAFRTLMD